MYYFQPVVARGETVLPCGGPLLEVKGKNATLGIPGAALRAKAGAAGSGHYLETPGGKKVEIGAVTVTQCRCGLCVPSHWLPGGTIIFPSKVPTYRTKQFC